MNLTDAMSTLRAVRRLRPDPIPDDVLGRLLQAATWAPSGGNAQAWRIIVVKDPETKKALADLYRPAWDEYLAQGRAIRTPESAEKAQDAGKSSDAAQRMVKAGQHLAEHMHEAPVLLVFCFDPRRMAFTDAEQNRPSVTGGASLYPAVQNLMLACVEAGIGCTLTTLHCKHEPEVKRLLGIPEEWGTSALVPLGYPVGRGHGPITRAPAEQMVHAERFGEAWSTAG